MAQEDSRQEGRRAERWARVNFPNKFVHPHEYTARDGRVFDKMFVSIPPGVTLNGVDLGGYAFDHFAKPREIEQKANGRPVAINFRPVDPVVRRGHEALLALESGEFVRIHGQIHSGPASGSVRRADRQEDEVPFDAVVDVIAHGVPPHSVAPMPEDGSSIVVGSAGSPGR